MEFERFAHVVRTEFQLEPAIKLVRSMTIVHDLEFDSFDLFRLALLAESLRPGFDPPADVDLYAITLGDVHAWIAAR